MDNKALVSSLLEPHPLVKIHRVNRKPETTLIFFQCWMAMFIFATILAVVFYFLVAFLISLSVFLSNQATVTEKQSLNYILISTPFLLPFTFLYGWLITHLMMKQNKKEHEPFLTDPNIFHRYKAQYPIYRVQQVNMQVAEQYEIVFSLCLQSLEEIKRTICDVYRLKHNLETGLIDITTKPKVEVLKEKHLKKKANDIQVKFEIRKLSLNKVSVKIHSYSKVIVKGIDFGLNIEIIYILSNYLKATLIENNKEVEICLP
jgi:heme/copper-type cytochrome/quinol oxidase subunit 2